MSRLLIGLIRLYQVLLSPYLGGNCRFEPSCSTYCIEAVQTPWRRTGSGLGLRRLLRCHPFRAGGYDPVPGSLNPERRSVL